MKKLIVIIGLIGLAIGCATRLETGGAYAPGVPVVENGTTNVVATSAPDMEFFLVDQAFSLAQGAANAVFETERSNREFLWKLSPKIKKTLDEYRPQATKAATEYAIARAGYEKNPTPAGLSILQTILGRIQQISDAVSAAMPKGK